MIDSKLVCLKPDWLNYIALALYLCGSLALLSGMNDLVAAAIEI